MVEFIANSRFLGCNWVFDLILGLLRSLLLRIQSPSLLFLMAMLWCSSRVSCFLLRLPSGCLISMLHPLPLMLSSVPVLRCFSSPVHACLRFCPVSLPLFLLSRCWSVFSLASIQFSPSPDLLRFCFQIPCCWFLVSISFLFNSIPLP